MSIYQLKLDYPSMSTGEVALRIQYKSLGRPPKISSARWSAMVNWVMKNGVVERTEPTAGWKV